MVINWTEKSAFIDGYCGYVTGKDGCAGARRSQGKSCYLHWNLHLLILTCLDYSLFESRADLPKCEATLGAPPSQLTRESFQGTHTI